MQVTGFGASASAWLSSIGKTTEAPTKLDVSLPAYDGKIERAEVAVPRMSFPTSAPVALGADGLLVLQEAGEAEPVAPSATEQFLELMKKSPEERLRDSILKSLGLTEDDLNSMAPEKRKMIEEMIAERIKDQITPVDGEVDLKSLDPHQLAGQLKVRSDQYLATDLLA